MILTNTWTLNRVMFSHLLVEVMMVNKKRKFFNGLKKRRLYKNNLTKVWCLCKRQGWAKDSFPCLQKVEAKNYQINCFALIWHTCVERLRTCCTSSCVSVGLFRNSFTMAVNSCSWTCVFSSWNPSKKLSNSSSALSIRSAYSPIIQIMEARASGSSRVSKFSHRVAIMLSYLFGYLRKISWNKMVVV